MMMIILVRVFVVRDGRFLGKGLYLDLTNRIGIVAERMMMIQLWIATTVTTIGQCRNDFCGSDG